MEREDLEKVRDAFQEMVDLINEILNFDDSCDEEEKEQKVAMVVYKMMKLGAKFK